MLLRSAEGYFILAHMLERAYFELSSAEIAGGPVTKSPEDTKVTTDTD